MSLRASCSIAGFISLTSCNNAKSTRSLSTFARSAFASRACSYHRVRRSSPVLVEKRAFHASGCTAAPKDPYKTLGVQKDATPAEIKKVYFSLARKFHPDTNPDKGAREKFVEIQEAYDILKDEKKRKSYDQFGAASQQPGFDSNAWANNPFGAGAAGFGGGFRGFSGGFGGPGGGSPNDLFSELFGAFGGGGGRPSGFSQNVRGEDLEATIGITFMEACKGTSRTINVNPVEDCSTCTGSGLKAGAKRTTCSTCGGSGTRTFVIESGFQMASTCTSCQGTGSTVPRGGQCGDCRGMGKVRSRRSVKVEVPAGVEDGMTIRIPNAGDASVSGKGPAGDLLVRVNVAVSKTFRRKGNNIYHEARIPMHTALLGGRVRVPTLDGDVDVRVPGGTQQGEEMVLKDRGVPRLLSSGGQKGDLFITFAVQLPRSLTPRQREILQQYADDVEGKTPTNSAFEPQKPPKGKQPESSSGAQASEEPETKDQNDIAEEHEENRNDHTSEDLDGQRRKRATA